MNSFNRCFAVGVLLMTGVFGSGCAADASDATDTEEAQSGSAAIAQGRRCGLGDVTLSLSGSSVKYAVPYNCAAADTSKVQSFSGRSMTPIVADGVGEVDVALMLQRVASGSAPALGASGGEIFHKTLSYKGGSGTLSKSVSKKSLCVGIAKGSAIQLQADGWIIAAKAVDSYQNLGDKEYLSQAPTVLVITCD